MPPVKAQLEGPGGARRPGKLPAYLAVAAQTLISAGTFLVAKDATSLFRPAELAWFRITLSGLLVVALAGMGRRSTLLPPRGERREFLLLALFGVILNQGFFLFGIHLSSALHAALLYAFTPVLVFAFASFWLGEHPTPLTALGIVLAVAGVFLVLAARGLDVREGPLRGDLLVLIAVAAWAAYTVLGKRVLARHDPFTVVVWVFGIAGAGVLPLGPLALRHFDPAGPGLKGWAELVYLCAFTSGVAFTLWYFALKRLEAAQVAVFTNLQAPLTALLAWLAWGDVPGLGAVIGGGLVLGGVTLVQLKPWLAGRAPQATRSGAS